MKLLPVLLIATALTGYAETRETGNFNYPVTKKMSNPLFVEFDSPMYGCDSVGPLYTADASAHVWKDGRLYVYSSHDMAPAWGCDRMDRYHVFSTDDMVNWTDHGEILNSQDVKEQGGWGIDGWMWAPDCAYNPKDGKYYFFFPHVNEPLPWGGHDWRVGVATSEYPDHGFKLIGYVQGAASLIDPCVFVDDDGQVYLYNGGGGQCRGARLDPDDWTKLAEEPRVMEGLHDFHEGTWIHKYNGKYYLSHADNNPGSNGNCLRYAVSDSPMGPWEDKGVYLFPTGSGTSHGSIVNYKGKWYAFYHASNYSGKWELRTVCVDPLKIDKDGTINLVENWGKPFKKPVTIDGKPVIVEAEDYNRGGSHYAFHKYDIPAPSAKYRKDDIGIARNEHNGRYVAAMKGKEWMRYSTDVKKPGKYNVTVMARTTTPDTKLNISVNGFNYNGQTVLPVSSGNGWTSLSLPAVDLDADSRYLDLRIDSGELDIDRIILTPAI